METAATRPGVTPRAWFLLVAGLAWRAVVRPRLALDLLRLAWSFRARRWWRRWPFLPLPPREYLRWRMLTAYGDQDAVPPLVTGHTAGDPNLTLLLARAQQQVGDPTAVLTTVVRTRSAQSSSTRPGGRGSRRSTRCGEV